MQDEMMYTQHPTFTLNPLSNEGDKSSSSASSSPRTPWYLDLKAQYQIRQSSLCIGVEKCEDGGNVSR